MRLIMSSLLSFDVITSDLKELEAELKKHKEKLTPGIVGES